MKNLDQAKYKPVRKIEPELRRETEGKTGQVKGWQKQKAATT